MKGFLPVAVIVALVGAIAACGSEDSTSNSGSVPPINSGPVEISGASSKDRRIAADLRDYIKPCPGAADEPLPEPPPGSNAERRLIRQYGSVEAFEKAFIKMRRTCGSYQRIAVKDGVITVKTTLESTDTQNAGDICNTIQGSDVADFTPGHTVLGEGNEVLARCPARAIP
jgi:hypothetical protein